MVVKCLECNSYSVFHAWLGQKSRVTEGCSCPNQLWIGPDEKIHAEDYKKIEVWNPAEKKFITHRKYLSLCFTQKTNHLNLTESTLESL